MAYGFNMGAAIKATIKKILQLQKPLLLILCTDSKSLYDCLVKLGTTQEKRLMVDLMCLCQSYERHEITEIKWINGGSNPADAMIKNKPCQALKELINTNTVNLKITEWVEHVGDDIATCPTWSQRQHCNSILMTRLCYGGYTGSGCYRPQRNET